MNHHLLLSDLAVRRISGNWGEAAVLPAYKRLVIDEGHHLEDAAAAHLGRPFRDGRSSDCSIGSTGEGRGLLSALIMQPRRVERPAERREPGSRDARVCAPAVSAVRDKSARSSTCSRHCCRESSEPSFG